MDEEADREKPPRKRRVQRHSPDGLLRRPVELAGVRVSVEGHKGRLVVRIETSNPCFPGDPPLPDDNGMTIAAAPPASAIDLTSQFFKESARRWAGEAQSPCGSDR